MLNKYYYISAALLLVSISFMELTKRKEYIPKHQSFKEFPMEYNDWKGTEFTFEKSVLDILRVDDYINRRYTRSGKEAWLYVGYYNAQRKGATYHSPKQCLPGGGWQIIKTTSKEIRPKKSKPFFINMLLIKKGLDSQLVFYWYQDRGRIIKSEYAAKLYLVMDSITKNRSDGSMVRVTVDCSKSQDKAEALASDFIESFFPLIEAFIPA